MTATTSEELAQLMSGVELLMLDFDGPICSVFAGLSASSVAQRLVRSLRELGTLMSPTLTSDDDPLSVYRESQAYGPAVTARINEQLALAEIEAIASARPTNGAADVVRAARASGRRVAIVSNNAAAAITGYVADHGLRESIDYIACRREPPPSLMKPNPAYLIEAAEMAGVPLQASAMIGDSTTDIDAARSAGVISIGYANKPGKLENLRIAGADGVIESMLEVVEALRR